MAINGPENFDDERAHNYLYTLMDQLQQEVKEYLGKREQNGFDPYDADLCNSVLLPRLDVLITLANHYSSGLSFDRLKFEHWQKYFFNSGMNGTRDIPIGMSLRGGR